MTPARLQQNNLRFTLDPLTSDAVRGLIATHLSQMHAQSPISSVHALDVSDLQTDDVQFWSVWQNDTLIGCAALKRLSATDGEVKSMHILKAYRGQGYAKAILRHVDRCALAMGLQRLFLETGSTDDFAPARGLYKAHGYQDCPPFGAYKPDRHSCFMSIKLDA